MKGAQTRRRAVEQFHRNYIGGLWDEIGRLQFRFLVAKGLKPQHKLLDVACGSLRLGVKAIPYLEKGRYLGIEKEEWLVEAGLTIELGQLLQREKQPNFVVSNRFEFEKLGDKADFAIAQSLFTHLPPDWIELCFKNLRTWLKDDGVFYATFFETLRRVQNPDQPNDHACFAYTQEEMRSFGENNAFRFRYIGDWKHPRHQVMVEYRPS